MLSCCLHSGYYSHSITSIHASPKLGDASAFFCHTVVDKDVRKSIQKCVANMNKTFSLHLGLKICGMCSSIPIHADQQNEEIRRNTKNPNSKANYRMLTDSICQFKSKGKFHIYCSPHRLKNRQSLGRSVSSCFTIWSVWFVIWCVSCILQMLTIVLTSTWLNLCFLLKVRVILMNYGIFEIWTSPLHVGLVSNWVYIHWWSSVYEGTTTRRKPKKTQRIQHFRTTSGQCV